MTRIYLFIMLGLLSALPTFAQKQDKTQEQPQPEEQMSRDNAQQMLDALLQDEKNTQEKVKKAQQQKQQSRKIEKQW